MTTPFSLNYTEHNHALTSASINPTFDALST
jgi:hypothetical protein